LDLLTYLDERGKRTTVCQQQVDNLQNISVDERDLAWKKHFGKERAALRRRRTRIRLSNFQILKQIGQGGYGQVFLVENRETNELCALKMMSKKLLSKLGEVTNAL
jgi:cell cycle protein kinase DBF2